MNKKDWYFIVGGACSLFIYFCLLYLFICHPYSLKIAQLQSINKKNEQQITLLQQFTAQHNDLGKYVKNIEQQNLFWQKLLPLPENTAQVITALQTLADKENIIILKIEPLISSSTNNEKLPYNTSMITLQIQSNYFELLNFLYSIDILPYYSTIENFSAKKSSNMLISNISIQYYSLKPSK
ncbi:hypothetical protein [Pectinatus brassicae]|uniref:Uncharacterized protein n=1 Tax=Pectinatus brassicae TaxID=862415 RepID=A0A840UUM7_9FIRM|nr:hypothetical protein [Pectinatus brassicae]MBB5336514.1 hypothetical protein [Pectinatus brassicae]